MKKICGFLAFLIMTTVAINASGDGKAFRERLFELTAPQESAQVLPGKDGWLFLKEELEHVAAGPFWGKDAPRVSKATKPEYADPLPAIVDFNRQLQKEGVQLLLVPIPPKVVIYPDAVVEDAECTLVPELAKTYQDFYAMLADEGVKVLDLIPSFSELRKEKDLYCKTDTHYSGAGLVHVASRIGVELQKLKLFDGVATKQYVQNLKPTTITGDLAVMLGKDASQEVVELSYVTEQESGDQLTLSTDSPVLLMGDSHTLVFSAGGDMHATGAGLAENISASLGFPIDLLGIRGSGSTPVRIQLYQKIRKNKEYLKGKKIIVWVLTARDFTGLAGWRKIPVIPK